MQDQPVTTTAVCEADRHHLCRGRVVSLAVPAGTACACGCHARVDLAVEARLEAAHFGEAA